MGKKQSGPDRAGVITLLAFTRRGLMDDPNLPEKTGILLCLLISLYFGVQMVKSLLVF